MKKRILIISTVSIALVFLCVSLWLVNGIFGNPLSAFLAKRSSERHLQEHYSGTDYIIEDVSFSFKDGNYYAHVESPGSDDSFFSIVMKMDGRVLYDTYEDRVARRGNTAHRLDMEYRRRVEDVLESAAFPYDVHIGFGEICFTTNQHKIEYDTPTYAIVTDDLTLDGFYDVNKLGAQAGVLTVYIYDETVSVQRLSEMLLEIRRIFDASGVAFCRIDCVLEYPKDEKGNQKEGRVEVMGFAYSQIYAEGLAERVAASDKAAREYYAKQDAEKLNEQKI